MAAPRVTLADVAAAAGVSPSTASRALHGGAGVRQQVVDRIRSAAESLGYQVNYQARSLRRGRDQAIGLVVEDFAIPFFGQVASVTENMARARGLGVVIACSGTDMSEVAAVTSLLSRNVAGLLVGGATGRAPAGYLSKVSREVPLVVFDAASPDPAADTVTVDNVEGGRWATAHLLAQGHRQVMFVGSGRASTTVAARRRGYLQAFEEAGIAPNEQLTVWAGHTTPEVQQRVSKALEDRPEATAVFSSGARTTPGTLLAKAALNRHDLSFTGMDEVEGGAAFTPPLTVAEQDVPTIARSATELLFERMDGLTGPARHVQVPLAFLERGSGDTTRDAAPLHR